MIRVRPALVPVCENYVRRCARLGDRLTYLRASLAHTAGERAPQEGSTEACMNARPAASSAVPDWCLDMR